ncbi:MULTISPECIES: phage tail protein [unclassified Sporosarcina]|uniref:phage tail protein n=1 Tax=unclassified Sporosarcina TaxID=2647733 RepID=UPI000A19E950|nr:MULTISPECIES: phage tail protein [unclassified Sporosarcina]PID19378.1 hypothetical protein CSV62_02420 [Sporosarcina sp. P35]
MRTLAIIGSFGEVIFEVSPKKLLSFHDMERSNKSRWSEHEIHGKKPKLEFEGAGLSDVSYRVLLRAENGVNPIKEIEKLNKMNDSGKAAHFILGSKPISRYKFIITEITEAMKNIDQSGNLLSAEVTVKLKEYVEDKVEVKKTTSNTKTNSTSKTNSKQLETITITAKSIHIRSGPGVKNKVIGYAYKGDKLKVISTKNGWHSLGGGKYISANKAYSSLKKG